MPLLLVVRHGQADGNLDHRFIGQTDVALDHKGREQAESLARHLVGRKIDRIISSDLSRAVDTVAPLAERLSLPIEIDRRLREIGNGEWSGLLPTEIAAGWPDLWMSYLKGADVQRPGGETWEEVRARVLDVVSDLEDFQGTVVLCTHGGPALNLARWAVGHLSGGNIFRGSLAAVANASITSIELPGPRLVSFNETIHLGAGALSPGVPYLPSAPS